MSVHLKFIDKATFLRLKGHLWKFIKREWVAALIWAAIGMLSAAVVRLIWSDVPFGAYCLEKYKALRTHYNGFHSYSIFLIAAVIAIALAVSAKAVMVLWKGLRSWGLGVTSGLSLVSFLSSLFWFVRFYLDLRRALIFDGSVIGFAWCISFGLYWRSLARNQRRPTEGSTRVNDRDRRARDSSAGTDDPIDSWEDDLLDRAPLIDSAAFSLLISRTPTLALYGPLGAGKTSILNLLSLHLRKRAIVVFFSTWLPGSADTLSSYLLEDISRQCRKEYVIPGMQKSARRLALALAKRVPLLDAIFDFLSESTQREEIQNLANAVARLPRRVVVLLDEIDRMGKPELESLLKVLRGLCLSSNLSFVCAFDRGAVEKTARGTVDSSSALYFEKFFPVSISVPVIDEEALKRIGINQLVRALDRRGWFEFGTDREKYKKEIGELWPRLLAPFCTTIRKIRLLANNVEATSYIRGEIDMRDLTLMELLRSFEPSVHEIVWRFREALTEGEQSWARHRYLSDENKTRVEKDLSDEINKALEADPRAQTVKEILDRLFAYFQKIAEPKRGPLPRRQGSDEDADRISDPGVMRTYFHQKVGEDRFSSNEMRRFMRELEVAENSETINRLLIQKIASMEKGDPRRGDFLDKLSDEVRRARVKLSLAAEIVHASMRGAGHLAYDFFFGAGEAGDALRMVIRVTGRITEHRDRVMFLGKCIREAGDDTMALRILTALSNPGQDFYLQVSFAELYPHFIARMTNKYGPDVDAENMDLSFSDNEAMRLWGFADLSKEGMALDPQDVAQNRATQQNFWLRYIGVSRKRLAQAVNRFFFVISQYEIDPRRVIEDKISMPALKQLYESVEDDGSLTIDERVSLRMLERLLNGEFAQGVGASEWENERRRLSASEQDGERGDET
jgi:hypothetical protein